MVTLLLGDGNLKLEMLIQLIFDYLEAGRNISFTWSRRRFHHCNNGVKCIEHSPLTACTEKIFAFKLAKNLLGQVRIYLS